MGVIRIVAYLGCTHGCTSRWCYHNGRRFRDRECFGYGKGFFTRYTSALSSLDLIGTCWSYTPNGSVSSYWSTCNSCISTIGYGIVNTRDMVGYLNHCCHTTSSRGCRYDRVGHTSYGYLSWYSWGLTGNNSAIRSCLCHIVSSGSEQVGTCKWGSSCSYIIDSDRIITIVGIYSLPKGIYCSTYTIRICCLRSRRLYKSHCHGLPITLTLVCLSSGIVISGCIEHSGICQVRRIGSGCIYFQCTCKGQRQLCFEIGHCSTLTEIYSCRCWLYCNILYCNMCTSTCYIRTTVTMYFHIVIRGAYSGCLRGISILSY